MRYICLSLTNECSELNITNIENQNSGLQKGRHCQFISNRLLFLSFWFGFTFMLLALETQLFSKASVQQ